MACTNQLDFKWGKSLEFDPHAPETAGVVFVSTADQNHKASSEALSK